MLLAMDTAIAGFIFHNTSLQTGHLFVNPEELLPCHHKIESVVRRTQELKGNRMCPTCNQGYLAAKELEDMKLMIKNYSAQYSSLASNYRSAIAHEASLQTHFLALENKQKHLQKLDQLLQKHAKEDWIVRIVTVIVFALFWKFGGNLWQEK